MTEHPLTAYRRDSDILPHCAACAARLNDAMTPPRPAPIYDWRCDTAECLLAVLFAGLSIGGLYAGLLWLALLAQGGQP